jgi:hypothetical protein
MISIDFEFLGDVQVSGSCTEDEFSVMLGLDDDVLTLKGTERALRTALEEMLDVLDGLSDNSSRDRDLDRLAFARTQRTMSAIVQ